MSDHRYLYCWFDTEYTTLDLDRAKLLQVALIVTDDDLVPIESSSRGVPQQTRRTDGYAACVSPPPREEMSDHVLEHYQPLLERCEREGLSVDTVDAHLAAYLDAFPETRHQDIRERPILAGNTIYPDYFLARKFLPQFLARLNYRMLDVSSIKLEWLYHYRGPRFRKMDSADNIRKYYRGRDEVLGNKHDAYYDIQASMAELAYYRSHIAVDIEQDEDRSD